MKFKKASVKEKLDAAYDRDPRLFGFLMERVDELDFGKYWPYLASKNKDGYGQLKIRGRQFRANRVMFALFFPDIEAPVVRHSCNNPSCINPAHLKPGTQKDNVMDRVLSGRNGYLKGSKNGRSVLTEDQAREIKDSNKSGAELARIYGISRVMACAIKRGVAWKHI